jgi:hypothetical protein
VPQSPGDPSISALTGTNPWTTKVSAPYAGQWKLKFTASVTYKVWNKKKDDYQRNEDGSIPTFGPFTGSGTCTFIATNKPWKVELSTDNIIVRRATNPQQQTVPYKKVTAKLIDADSAKNVTISSSGGGELRFGMNVNAANTWNTTQQSLSLTIPKDGTKDFYVSGEKESSNIDDTSIVATSNDFTPECVGAVMMTVLWVEISYRTSGKVSDLNDKKEDFARLNEESDEKKYDLGKRIVWQEPGKVYSAVYEIVGIVSPSDFSQHITLVRDAEDYHKFFDNLSMDNVNDLLQNNENIFDVLQGELKEGFESETIGELSVNDTSPDSFLDKVPKDIFDLDCPGMIRMRKRNGQT